MITHNNEALYRELFDLAEERLNETFGMKNSESGPVEINDLETYFHHLRDLVYGPNDEAAGNKQLLEEGYIFLKLPSVEEEGHFIIDANKRKIDTSNFNAVLSVEGDEIAEIVFFEIDRFFDATDLNQMDIAIQWSTKINGVSVEDYTPAFIKYIDPKTDKLIFGWPITSEVTASAGAISFSVRFYKKDPVNSGKLLYSFTTLPAVMNIGASLQVDIANLVADDPTNTILNRLMNSPLDGVEDVSTPWFVFSNATDNLDAITSPVELYALAAKTNGSLTYQWFYNNEPLSDVWVSAADQNYYVNVTNFIPDIATYYYLKNDQYTAIPIINAEKFAEYLTTYSNLYVNCAVYELNADTVQAGTYHVDCRNLYNGDVTYASGSVVGEDLSKLPKWIVQGPAEIIIDTAVWPAELAFGQSLEATVTSGIETSTKYEWIYRIENNEDTEGTVIENVTGISYIPDKEGYYQLKMSNTKNKVTTEAKTPLCLVLDEIADFTVNTVRNNDGSYTASLSRDLGFGESVNYIWKTSGENPIVLSEEATYIPAAIGTGCYVFATINKGLTLGLSKEVRSGAIITE